MEQNKNSQSFSGQNYVSPQSAAMKSYYTPKTAAALIIANMVGMGVFTSLGFQLLEIQDGFVILMLWLLGGVAALCGAASYAELGAALPRSGGEYNFLSRIYHPIAGFISGWVSATIGFAAPVAAIAIAFGAYTAEVIPGDHKAWVKPLAIGLVVLVTLIHGRNRESSSRFQIIFTALKIGLILAFCFAALIFVPEPQAVRILPAKGDFAVMTSSTFAVALIYVTYSYTGWNAATYITGELENPQRDLPKVLILGTGLVMAVYILLNYVFMRVAPVAEMAGQVEIGYIAAKNAFGDIGGRLTGGILALLLISSVSAMTLAGPRALQAIGEDFQSLKILSRTNKAGVPHIAIYLQSFIAVLFILTSSFKTIMVFAAAMLAFNSFLTVFGVFVLRWKEPNLDRPYKTWAYPLTPIIYLLITGFTLVYVIQDNPLQALVGLAVIMSGAVFYWLTKPRS